MITTDRKPAIDNSLKNSWGMRFQAAREAMNLSEKDAAARLHLKPHIINIIESERFAEGPPVIFMRGYIRSYGRMLNLPEKDLTQALAQLDFGSVTAPPVPSQFRMRENPNNSSSLWSTAFVVLVLTGLVGTWWWNSHVRNAPIVDAATTATPYELTHTAVAATPPAPAAPVPEANIAAALNTTQTTPAAPVTPANPNTLAPSAQTTAPAAEQPKVADITPQPTAVPAPLESQTIDQAPAVASVNPAPAEPAAPVATNTAPATPVAPPVEAAAPATEDNSSTTTTNVASTDDTADNDDQPAPVKPHTSKNKSPNLADSEMSVPEEGLDNEVSE